MKVLKKPTKAEIKAVIADYAYVKDSKDESTVFFLRSPGYDEGPISGKKEP